ncbi:uncharacterized [Tachysurus ichikawai]
MKIKSAHCVTGLSAEWTCSVQSHESWAREVGDRWLVAGLHHAPSGGGSHSQARKVRKTEEEDQFFEHRKKLGMKLKLAIADRCLIPAAVKLLLRQICAIAQSAWPLTSIWHIQHWRKENRDTDKGNAIPALRWLPVSGLMTCHYLYCLRPSARSVQSGLAINQSTSGEAKVTGPDSHH